MDQLRRVGLAAGLAAVGVTSADVLEPARTVLPSRRQVGLAATMQFTYRNPDRSTDPTRILSGADSMVVGLLSYHRRQPPRPEGLAAQVARYAWVDYYQQLREGLEAIAEILVAAGFKARIVADSNALVDRNAAWRAGLGWYGKNSNLLVAEAGSWYVLGAVVTDAHLERDGPAVTDGCGSCTSCIDECPTQALVAPGVLDARRCIAWLVQAAEPIPVELRPAIEDRIYGCDICQEVCPPNKISLRRSPPPDPDSGADAWVDMQWLLQASDDDLLDRYGRWYLANRDPDVLRRTALVVLGNIADPADPAVRSLLTHYLRCERPLLRAHAVWATRRLGLDGLLALPADEADPMVLAELEGPVEVRSQQ